MIAYLSLFTLQPHVTPEILEHMMATTRVRLLRVPEILAVKTGKRIRNDDAHDWFVYLEVESMDKLAICLDDPHYLKFVEDVLKPHIESHDTTAFEMEPRKNPRYS